MILVPKNWGKFQHYKDRCPPWIKLHRDILNDRTFANLPIASKALAPLLWLLASESKDGSFDAAIEELAFRLHIASKDIESGLKPLIDKGFFVLQWFISRHGQEIGTAKYQDRCQALKNRNLKKNSEGRFIGK